jgi:hypothetical protein
MFKTTDAEFDKYILDLLTPYKCNYWKQSKDAKCVFNGYSAQEQQKFVSIYFNIHNPSKGITLWHGLGSGKTCSAIFISNFMREYKDVCVIAPAMLRDNFKNELEKSCGLHIIKSAPHPPLVLEDEVYMADMGDYDFISSNGNLNTFSEKLYNKMNGKLIIIDESQILLNKINNSFKKRRR